MADRGQASSIELSDRGSDFGQGFETDNARTDLERVRQGEDRAEGDDPDPLGGRTVEV